MFNETFTIQPLQMLVYKVILNVVLLLQYVMNGQQENCSEGDFRQQQGGEDGIFIQYCSGGSWHYLCSGGVGWTPTLATVACRQLGYSDQGANVGLSITCNDLPENKPTTFRTNQLCNGTETSLIECGGVHRVNGVNETCPCGQVAEIMCQPAATEAQSPPTTTSTITIDSVSPTTTSQDDNTTSINNTALGAVIGVLVALVAVVLITVVCVVVVYMHKKRSAIHQHSYQLEGPSTKKNECYSLRQLDDPVYDEAAQPNYSSLSLDVEAVNDQVTNGYDSIKCMTKPGKEVANSTPRNESFENDFHDTEQHINEEVNANKKKKAQNKSDDRHQQQTNAQETPASPTPVRNEDSEVGNDFYDVEEHTYSVVNNQKKSNKKLLEDEGEKKKEDFYQ